MTDRTARSLDLNQVVVHLADAGTAQTFPMNDAFWADLGAGKLFQGGWLFAKYDFRGRWDHWEMHPLGEEIIYLLSGALAFVFDLPEGERRVTLEGEGSYLIVPRGVWHIAEASKPCSILSITAGDGTEHRPD
ncbi:MAG: cupin domain-containing protein [Myxococcota bacterium]